MNEAEKKASELNFCWLQTQKANTHDQGKDKEKEEEVAFVIFGDLRSQVWQQITQTSSPH